jgi:serine/threonine protein kinase
MSVEEARQQIMDPRYSIDEFIGAGAMACVYKARERGTPNVYALKVLREEYHVRRGFVEVFEREANHMRDLQYPNIVRFYKFVNEEHIAYILMDHIEGEPLTQHIRQVRANSKTMPIPKIVRIMAQIARAISYLHSEGYIHRDIKPGNVLLAGEDQSAFLTDLGIAGGFDAQEALGGAGTPSYMPYEQQIGGNVDHTVDIYAFAIMLFELFTNQKPYLPRKGLNIQQARNAIRDMHHNGEIPSLVELQPELPEEIDEIFQHALAKEPSERYQDVMDFAQDIHELLKPDLPDDLKNFADIRPREIKRSVIQTTKERVTVHSQRNTGRVILGGVGAILLIGLVVIGGIWLNLQILGSEAITSPTSTFTSTSTLIPTFTPTLTPTFAPTFEPTDLATEETIQPTMTPFLSDETVSIVLEGAEALGLGDELNIGLAYAIKHGGAYVPLRLDKRLNGFEIELALRDGTQANFSAYGLVFRVQDKLNYLRFRIVPAQSNWVLEAIQNGEPNLIASDAITGALPSVLSVRGLDNYLSFAYDNQVMQERIESKTGGVGLWLETEDANSIVVDYLHLGLIAEDDARSLILPELNQLDYILQDVRDLRVTGDASALVQCSQFINLYNKLGLYLEGFSMDFAPQAAEFARQAQGISAFIHSRCKIDGQDAALDFTDSYSDYLTWDNGLEALINQIEAAQ